MNICSLFSLFSDSLLFTKNSFVLNQFFKQSLFHAIDTHSNQGRFLLVFWFGVV